MHLLRVRAELDTGGVVELGWRCLCIEHRLRARESHYIILLVPVRINEFLVPVRINGEARIME